MSAVERYRRVTLLDEAMCLRLAGLAMVWQFAGETSRRLLHGIAADPRYR